MKQRGFTLIEILVVMLIVSIMTGIALINLPQFTLTETYDKERQRLGVVLAMARDEALYQASEYGFRVRRDEYAFFIYNEVSQAWEELEERPFETRELPSELALRLEIEGESLSLGTGEGIPPVLILSSGEITPFALTISDRQQGLADTLTSDGYGELVWDSEKSEEDEDD